MTESYIIDIINDYRNEYRNKDGGREFIHQLARKLQNTIEKDREEVLAFFLNEIRCNKNGFGEIALATIVDMNAKELAPIIEQIFNEKAVSMNEEWRYSIIYSLMTLEYASPKSLYSDYVISYIQKNYDNCFSLLLNYSNIDPGRALPLLADYFIDQVDGNRCRMQIALLFHAFYKSSIDNLYVFLRDILLKNQIRAIFLKEQILEYFETNLEYTIEQRCKISHEIKTIFRFAPPVHRSE